MVAGCVRGQGAKVEDVGDMGVEGWRKWWSFGFCVCEEIVELMVEIKKESGE